MCMLLPRKREKKRRASLQHRPVSLSLVRFLNTKHEAYTYTYIVCSACTAFWRPCRVSSCPSSLFLLPLSNLTGTGGEERERESGVLRADYTAARGYGCGCATFLAIVIIAKYNNIKSRACFRLLCFFTK